LLLELFRPVTFWEYIAKHVFKLAEHFGSLVRVTRNRIYRTVDVADLVLLFLLHVRSLAHGHRASGGQVLLIHYMGFKDIA
jgi:hypothetical protein